MNADISPQDAIERVRERGDIIRWESFNSTFTVHKPDETGDIVHEFEIRRDGLQDKSISPLSLLNVLASQDFMVVTKDEIRR